MQWCGFVGYCLSSSHKYELFKIWIFRIFLECTCYFTWMSLLPNLVILNFLTLGYISTKDIDNRHICRHTSTKANTQVAMGSSWYTHTSSGISAGQWIWQWWNNEERERERERLFYAQYNVLSYSLVYCLCNICVHMSLCVCLYACSKAGETLGF